MGSGRRPNCGSRERLSVSALPAQLRNRLRLKSRDALGSIDVPSQIGIHFPSMKPATEYFKTCSPYATSARIINRSILAGWHRSIIIIFFLDHYSAILRLKRRLISCLKAVNCATSASVTNPRCRSPSPTGHWYCDRPTNRIFPPIHQRNRADDRYLRSRSTSGYGSAYPILLGPISRPWDFLILTVEIGCYQ